jgi:hypothetical protein
VQDGARRRLTQRNRGFAARVLCEINVKFWGPRYY